MGARPPIFVIGFARSGTTLLQAMLGAHRNIAVAPEMHFLARIWNLRDYYGDLNDDDNLRRALHDTIHPPYPGLDACEFDEDTLFEQARRRRRGYAELLDVVLGDLAERRGKGRWSEKTPEQRAGPIAGLFPDALIVHIVRDPRAAVASGLRVPYEERSAAMLARDWRDFESASRTVGESLGPGRYLRISYEVLVADSEDVLRHVCAFLDEEFDPAMLDPSAREASGGVAVMATWQAGAIGEVSADRRDAWRRELTIAQRLRVEACTAEVLRADGYAMPSRAHVGAGRLLDRLDRRGRRREANRVRGIAEAQTPDERHREVVRRFEEMAARGW